MQTDPAMEWRRLAEEYHARSDEELRDLAADFPDLTQSAQQILRQEMRSRGLGDPAAATATLNADSKPQPSRTASPAVHTQHAISGAAPGLPDSLGGVIGRAPRIVSDEAAEQENSGEALEYTWKTVLCECETNEQAQALSTALRQAGLDSWVQWPREFSRRYARILVAADQLDRAREIAAQPVPKEVIDESQEDIPEFVEPKCPKCGSMDVVLEGVDIRNHWRCEACENEWSDDAEVQGSRPANAGEATS
jgi:hypothetical protein